ncbi:MAG: prolyl oligopeptidase family serine peptidase [Bdellovibrionota bacterium]
MKNMLCSFLILLSISPAFAQVPEDSSFGYLEQQTGKRARHTVKDLNKSSKGIFESSVYQKIYADLDVLYRDSSFTIDPSAIMGGKIFVLNQNEDHPRGALQWQSLNDYKNNSSQWNTLVDAVEASRREGMNVGISSFECLAPTFLRCLVFFSEEGEDAEILREYAYSSQTKTYVPITDDPFVLEKGFHIIDWADENTLVIGTDLLGKTDAGYPSSVRIWRRGEDIENAAVIHSIPTNTLAVFANKVQNVEDPSQDFFVFAHYTTDRDHHEHYLARNILSEDPQIIALDLTDDADYLSGNKNHLFFLLKKDWSYQNVDYAQGSIVSLSSNLSSDSTMDVRLVFSPGRGQIAESVRITKDYYYLDVVDNAQSQLWQLLPPVGEESTWRRSKVALPANGTLTLWGSSQPDHNQFFVSYDTCSQPKTYYLVNGPSSIEKIKVAKTYFDQYPNYETKQLFATSKDGTQVPYFFVYDKTKISDPNQVQKENQKLPTIVEAYGGFGITSYCNFSNTRGMAWLGRGGAYVIANIRGGGIYGPQWYLDGVGPNKQNSYDDLYAVAEDLIQRGLTDSSHLGVYGRSNGGLMTGVAFTQRPDLFNAFYIGYPLLDLQRYTVMKSDDGVAEGKTWIEQYGDPETNDWENYMKAYSPYQNLSAEKKYPKPFIVTSTRDDRVHPAHARKFAAKMQQQGHDFYFYESPTGGHGGADSLETLVENWTLVYSYFSLRLMNP